MGGDQTEKAKPKEEKKSEDVLDIIKPAAAKKPRAFVEQANFDDIFDF